ncbi:hypothetical protein [Peredibacter starrii]|uniref:Uncharacterized protein n=1 Tax=Peredibacter starrii TaxID=28202 RepID=A0AAX4HSD9_9BACT|nr:hypothetical protein [Peredibacter starrii]WPU66018.1 hypothetical protein SOO65_04600 [Peredibacter starrii]
MFKLLVFTFIMLMSFGAAAESVLTALNPFKQSSNAAVFCESAYENYRSADNYVPGATQIRVEVPSTPEKLQDGDLISIVSAIRLYRGEKKDIISDCTVRTNGKLQALNMTALSSVVSFEQTADLEAEKSKQKRFEGQVAACKKLKEDRQCTAFDVDAKNVAFIEDVSKDILSNVTETDGCNCIKQVMKQAELWNEKEFNEQKKLTQDRMHDSIMEGFGKKFLNDYAANIEDVGYFQVNAAKFFGLEKGSQVSAAKNYECSDISKYESAIDKKCSANGISPAERQKRLNKIFNAYGNTDSDDQMTLGQRFSKLNQKIQFLDDGQVGKNGGYSRKDHDAKRFALARKEDSIQMLDTFIRSIFSDSAKSSKLTEMIEEYGGAPIGALAEFMMDEAKKNPTEFSRKYFSNKNLNSDYVKKSKQFLFDKKIFDDVKYQAIVTQIELGMGIHPGLKAMLTDKNIFIKAAKAAVADDKSIVETLEKNDSILGTNYQKRCQDLIEKLSEATCIKDTDIIGKVSGNEIAALLKGKGYPENTKYELLVSCEAGSEFTQKPFDDLVMKDPYTHSDLKDRLTKPANEQKNAFRRLHDSKDSAVQDKVESAVAETRSQREEVKDRSLASYKYAGGGEGTKEGSTEVAHLNSIASSDSASTRSAEVDSSSSFSAAPNFMAAPVVMPSTVSAPAAIETPKSDLKSEVRDSLSNKDNQDKVEKLLSNTDDSSMRELLRLKEESLKNRQKILELTSENEKQKLKDLEEKIKLLETKKQQIAQTQHFEEEEDDSVSRQRNTLKAPSRDIASIRPMMDSSGSGSGDYGGTGGSSGGSFGSGGLAPTSGRGGSSAAAARSAVNSDKSSDSSSDGYIVISNDNVSQGVKSQEVSQELINLLSSSDPDLSALKKLKDSGMLYKFKVMENGVLVEKEVLVDYKMLNEDAKKLVESKLAIKQHSQIETELVAARRVHSFQALKIILGEQLRK